MTPIEKAKWLVNEMTGYCCGCEKDAKHAALVCCSEVIDHGPCAIIQSNDGSPDEIKSLVPYWQAVKTEIEKL